MESRARLEPPGVDSVHLQPQHVAVAGTSDHVTALTGSRLGLQPPSQMTDVGLQSTGRVGRQPVAPHHEGQPLRGDHLTAVHEEGGEHGTLAPTSQLELDPVAGSRQLPSTRSSSDGSSSTPISTSIGTNHNGVSAPLHPQVSRKSDSREGRPMSSSARQVARDRAN